MRTPASDLRSIPEFAAHFGPSRLSCRLSWQADARSLQYVRHDALEPGSGGKRKKGNPMTLNPAPQSSFSEHRSPARGGVVRWKSGTAPAVLPLISATSTPKVWLKDISLTYRWNNGSRQ